MVQSHNISVSASSDKATTSSRLVTSTKGILRYQYLKRYNVRPNTQFVIKDKIRVGENAYLFFWDNQSSVTKVKAVLSRQPTVMSRLSSRFYDIARQLCRYEIQRSGERPQSFADIYRTKDNHGYNWDISRERHAEVDFLEALYGPYELRWCAG